MSTFRAVTTSGAAPRAAPRRSFFSAALREEVWSYLFIAPSLLAFIAFALYPMLDSIILSFHHFTLRTDEWVGLDNYVALASSSDFFLVLKNTALYVVEIVPFGVVLTLVLSILIFRLSTAAQIFFKSAYYLPVVTSGVVLSLIWLYLYDPGFGLLDYIIRTLGHEPILWLSDPRFSILSLVIMYHASSWGGAVILVTASLGGIPEHLYEAARIDGASQIRQAFTITLPLLRPAIAYVAITGTIAALQIFTEIFIMTGGGPNYATANLVYFIYDRAFTTFDFSMASAVAVILLAITVVISIAQFRFFSSDVEY